MGGVKKIMDRLKKITAYVLIAVFGIFALIQTIPNIRADTQTGFIVASAGKDGQFGTSDDIVATDLETATNRSANISTANAVPSAKNSQNNISSTRIRIAAGYAHTAALKSDGTVWTWGNNRYGQLGDGTTIDRTTPIQVKGLTDVIAIAADSPSKSVFTGHTVALKSDGTVWTWGWNAGGQLGDGTTIGRTTPVQVKNLTDVVAIAAGQGHTVALKRDGTVWAWGYNGYGQLGDGTTTTRTTPVQVQNLNLN